MSSDADQVQSRIANAIGGQGKQSSPDEVKETILLAKKNQQGGQRYNPTTPGVLGQKVYCTHWMRTGECDFTQQGCMFLHSMPDLDTLELLGFRSYPRWFREMPRDYQIQNAKDFDEIGLDTRRHMPPQDTPTSRRRDRPYGRDYQHDFPRPHNFFNGFGPGYGPYANFIPGHGYVPPGARGFPPPAYYPPGMLTMPPSSSPSNKEITSASENSPTKGNPVHPAQLTPAESAIVNTPELHHSLFSRDTSPTGEFLNRSHKPLEPAQAPHYSITAPTHLRAPRPTHAGYRPLNDGAPSTPDIVPTRRFQNQAQPKAKTFSAPDSKVAPSAHPVSSRAAGNKPSASARGGRRGVRIERGPTHHGPDVRRTGNQFSALAIEGDNNGHEAKDDGSGDGGHGEEGA